MCLLEGDASAAALTQVNVYTDMHGSWLPEGAGNGKLCLAMTGEAMPRRLLGMQPAGWASPQLHPYAHDPVMEDPEHHAWTMLGSTAQGNIYSRLAAPRRFFSDSPEHAQEVSRRLTS